jgi:hypothetical protein
MYGKDQTKCIGWRWCKTGIRHKDEDSACKIVLTD